MYVITQNGRKVVNLDRYDYFELSDKTIYAYQGERYVILGKYETEEEAKEAFLYFQGWINIIRMNV